MKKKSADEKLKTQLNKMLKGKDIPRGSNTRYMLRILIALAAAVEKLGVKTSIFTFADVLQEYWGYERSGVSKFLMLSDSTKKKEIADLSRRASRFVEFAYHFFPEYGLSLTPVTSMNGEIEVARPYIGFALHKGPNGGNLEAYISLLRRKIDGMIEAQNRRVDVADFNGGLLDSTRERLGLIATTQLALPEHAEAA